MTLPPEPAIIQLVPPELAVGGNKRPFFANSVPHETLLAGGDGLDAIYCQQRPYDRSTAGRFGSRGQTRGTELPRWPENAPHKAWRTFCWKGTTSPRNRLTRVMLWKTITKFWTYRRARRPRKSTPPSASWRRRCHPDVRPEDENALAQFKLAKDAYDVLSDAEKRRQYDRQRSSAAERSKMKPGAGRGRHKFGSSSGSAHKVPHPAAHGGRSGPGSFLDAEVELRLVPEEAVRGGPMEVRCSVRQACQACDGQGAAGRGCVRGLRGRRKRLGVSSRAVAASAAASRRERALRSRRRSTFPRRRAAGRSLPRGSRAALLVATKVLPLLTVPTPTKRHPAAVRPSGGNRVHSHSRNGRTSS